MGFQSNIDDDDDRMKRATSFVKFRDLIDLYDVFLLDQYGVLHNGGSEPLEGVIECLTQLIQHKKHICINSNSPRSSQETLQKLVHSHGLSILGTSSSSLIHVVTSGELLHRYIRQHYTDNNTKKRCICFGWDDIQRNQQLGTSHNIISTINPNEADYILVLGTGGIVDTQNGGIVSLPSNMKVTGTLEAKFIEILQIALQRNLPMLVGNNDIMARSSSSDTGSSTAIMNYCCGIIANYYHESMIVRFGKPSPLIFQECIQTIIHTTTTTTTTTTSTVRVCHVGDSLHHDIIGANNANIDSIFIAMTGIHANEISHTTTEQQQQQQRSLQTLFQQNNNIIPTYTAQSFQW